MKLYHGTSSRFLDKIIKDGLKPRGRRKGNWQHTVSSHPQAVYLTSVYPWHFARSSTKDEPGIILEIDTDKLNYFNLAPDEDAMEQTNRKHDGIGGDMKSRTRHYKKIARFSDEWEKSLDVMGTCAHYGDIETGAITRYAILDWSGMDQSIVWMCSDSLPGVLSYFFLKPRFQAFTEWIFGTQHDTSKLLGYSPPQILEVDVESLRFAHTLTKRHDEFTRIFKERKGITIVNKEGAGK